VHDKLIGEPNVQLIISNYSHNGYYDDNGEFISFVPDSIVEKIILNKEKGYHPNGQIKDAHFANIWDVYGMGKTGQLMGVVYPNVKWVPDLPPKELWKVNCLGLDFGYNDEAAMVRVVYALGKLWVKVLLYETGLTTKVYSERFEELGIKKGLTNGELIICDSARPEIIKGLRILKWNCKKCKKGAGSVFAGITDILGDGELQMVSNPDLKEEQRNYVWKIDKITGKPMEEPIDDFNHIMDAMRYAKQGLKRKKRNRNIGYT
jgi:phage terminase large subunit